ncbi:MAG: hypothetical protein L3J24_02195 [Xanthomonadales bacterium]|nr:hypothetical protein [Xanthomonadales bacterium]
MRVLLFLMIISQPAFGFEFGAGVIEIPQYFEGPLSHDMRGKGSVHVFKKAHKHDKTGAVLQITVFDPGGKFPVLSKNELREGAEKYLVQFLEGVERKRKGFVKSSIEFIEISGIPAAKISWTGSEYSRELEGVMYCYVYDSKIISLHTQDFKEYKGKYISQAVHAFENIKIKR